MNHPSEIIFEPLYEDVSIPRRATSGAAGYDVQAHIKGRTIETMQELEREKINNTKNTLFIEPGMRVVIPLGFRATIPPGWEAQIRLRSSAAFQKGLIMPNAPGTVDPDYPGEWLVLVANIMKQTVEIQHLERFAQVVFSRFGTVSWKTGKVKISTDRVGGLGSTGQ